MAMARLANQSHMVAEIQAGLVHCFFLPLICRPCDSGAKGFQWGPAGIRAALHVWPAAIPSKTNRFLCPLHVPIAVILNPKAGMNSVSTWLQFMATKHKHYRLFTELFDLWEGRKQFSDWLWSDAGLGSRISRQLPLPRRKALLRRLFFELRISDKVAWHVSKILLPPAWCVPCCEAAQGRLVLLLVRNPFRRVQSWFRHRWLSNRKKAPYNTWNEFPEFLHRLAAHKIPHVGAQSERPNFWQKIFIKPVDRLDLVHTLSFDDIMQDPHWTNEARNAMRKRIFPMRMERIDADFLHLQDVLCRSFSYCRPLPSLPKVVPHGSTGRGYMPQEPPPLQKLWTLEARETVRTMFQSDFRELGYSQDLEIEKPLALPRAWQKFNRSGWMTQKWQTSCCFRVTGYRQCDQSETKLRNHLQYLFSLFLILFSSNAVDSIGSQPYGVRALCMKSALCTSLLRTPKQYTYHVSRLSRAGAWREALQLARSLRKTSSWHLLDVRSFGAELLACAKGSMWTLSLSKLDEMKNLHIQPNMVVWSEIVAAVAAERHWRIALDLLRRAEDCDGVSIVVYNSVMTAFEGDWQKAVLVLEASASKRLQPSVVSLNSILSACAIAVNWAKVPPPSIHPSLAVQHDLQQSKHCYFFGIVVSAKSNNWQPYSTCSCMCSGRWPQSSSNACLASHGWKPEVVQANHDIAVASRNSQWRKCLFLLHRFRVVDLQQDAVSFNSAIGGLKRHWPFALQLFHEACLKSFTDSITYSACIAGLDWCNGLHLLAISTTSTGGRLLSAVNAAAAVCGGLRSSSGVASRQRKTVQNLQRIPKSQEHSEMSEKSNWSWSLELLQSAVKAEVKLDIVAFNAMVGAASGASGWQQAVNHFSALQRKSMSPDRITFSTFQVLPWQGALQLAHDMKRQSLRGDSQLSMLKSAAASAEAATSPGSDLWTKALCLCSLDLGKAKADKVDKVDKVSLALHRSVLGACAAAASWSQAVIAFVETAPASARKDNLSFLAAINACARGQQYSFTQHLLKTMENLKVEKTKEIYTAAMGSANDAFGQGLEGGWEWSLTLLREMQTTEVEVDAVALGVVLSVCLRARCWEVALQLAMDSGLFLTSTGAAAVMAGHALGRSWQRSLACFEGLPSKLRTTVVTVNPVLNAFSYGTTDATNATDVTHATWEAAMQLYTHADLEGVKLDTVSLNSAVSACATTGQWFVAFDLMRASQRDALECDPLTYNSALGAVGQGGQGLFWANSLDLLQLCADVGVEPGVAGYAATLDGCCHGRGWRLALSLGLLMDRHRALQVYSTSSDWRLKGDLTSLNSTMTACRNAARWDAVLALFQAQLAELDGVLSEPSLDVISFNITAGAYASSHSWQNAMACLKEMRKATLRPTAATFNILMTACEKSQHWQRALFLYKDMLQFHLEADATSYGALLSAFEQLDVIILPHGTTCDSTVPALCQLVPRKSSRIHPEFMAQASKGVPFRPFVTLPRGRL
eukprot:s206_g30.t4